MKIFDKLIINAASNDRLFKKKSLFLLLFILIQLNVFGQNVFSPEDLKNDLDSMVYQIESAHPNPYYRYSKNRFLKDVKKTKLSIHKPMTYMEFYLMAQKLVAKLEDGHIDLEMPIETFKKNQNTSFPFPVKLNITKPFITVKEDAYQQLSGIPAGSEILSINGISSQKILKDIVSMVTGESLTFRANYGTRYFDFYIDQLYPPRESYLIKYLHNDGIKTMVLKGKIANATQNSPTDSVSDKILKRPFKLELIKPGTALMTLSNFIDMEQFKLFADSAFESLKKSKTQNLIIDLRDNLGGDSDVGDYLLQYLLSTPFSQYDFVLEKNSQLLKNRLLSHRVGKPLSQADSVVLAKRNGTIDTIKNGTDQLLNLPNRFHEKVYLLINSQTFSSAADFAQAFSYYQRGPVIGEETGGLILSFGDIVQGVLPNTKLPFVVSSKLYSNIGAKLDDWHGVIPSIPIKSDHALKKALSLINE